MPGCGYICPKCSDTGFDDEGKVCDWCKPDEKLKETAITDEEWMEKVHQGPCCGDLGQVTPNPDCIVP